MVVILLCYHVLEIDANVMLENSLIYHGLGATLVVVLLLIVLICMAGISRSNVVFC